MFLRIPGRLRGPGHGGPAAAVPGPAVPGGLLQGQVRRKRGGETLPRGVGGDAQGTILRSEALLQFRCNRNFFCGKKKHNPRFRQDPPRLRQRSVREPERARLEEADARLRGRRISGGDKKTYPIQQQMHRNLVRKTGEISLFQNGVGIEDEVVGRQQEWNGGRGETAVDTMPMG